MCKNITIHLRTHKLKNGCYRGRETISAENGEKRNK